MSEKRTPGSEVLAQDPALDALLQCLARTARAVFLAGLPGTGKSLLVHELVRLADGAQRRVDLLQWDVARPAVERNPAAAAYPQADGVTHAVVRIAAGLWAREAVARWAATATPQHILIGETPLVGHRFIELARPDADEAEPFLSGPSCRFIIPVPSVEVRGAIEAERARRIQRPVHDREREDAAPHVLRAQWEMLAVIAARIDGARLIPCQDRSVEAVPGPYDPEVYERVYRFLLRHRHAQSIRMRTPLRVAVTSVYDFGVPANDLVPTEDEAAASIRRVEARFPDASAAQAATDDWYIV